MAAPRGRRACRPCGHRFSSLIGGTDNPSSFNDAVGAGKQAHLLLENNVFTGVKNPHEFDSSSDQSTANITARGNVYTNTSGTRATGGRGTAFSSASYKYTLDAASSVQAAVQSGAGPH